MMHIPHALQHLAHARQLFMLAGVAVDQLEMLYRRAQEDGGLAAYRLKGVDAEGKPVETLGYARWGEPERIASIDEKWHDRAKPCPWGPGVRRLPGLDAVLFVFPNDRNLRELPKVASVERLKRTLAPLPIYEPAGFRIREKHSTLDVLRYKPEQRLIARARLQSRNESSGEARTDDLIVRLFADSRGEALAATLTAWRDAGATAVLPEPLGALEDGHVYVERAVAGDTLRAAVRSGAIGPGPVARALATLHAARPAFPARRTIADRLSLMRRIATTLEAAGVSDVRALLARLEAARPAADGEAPVHGDLHARQMLVSGERVVLVDLERAALGDPLDDLGSLTAHLRWEHATMGADGAAAGPFADTLTEAYLACTDPRAARERAFFEACALVEIAELPIRRDLPEAAALAGRALSLAAASLERAGA